jgi:hypothetical protein
VSETRKASSNTKTDALGEVVSSSITGLVAECWTVEDADGMPSVQKPRFGSFLTVDSEETGLRIYAVVFNVITGPQDNMHRPSALGLTRERLKAEQPHIFSLLRTEVHAVTIGYRSGGTVFNHLPPQPPEVHDFVYQTSNSEIKALSEGFEFLRLLTTISSVPTDELLAASVREAYQARDNDYQFLIEAGQSLSHLLRSDYDRLLSVLRKIKPNL